MVVNRAVKICMQTDACLTEVVDCLEIYSFPVILNNVFNILKSE